MGIVHTGSPRQVGPPKDLILRLKHQFNISTLVETGTLHGQTAMWAASCFPKVFTIEYSREIYLKTAARLSGVRSIRALYGDSRTELQTIVPSLDSAAVFWLDSHWSGENTWGKGDECPLLQELAIIRQSRFENFIFIDDARMFLAPPPEPHDADQWPSVQTVLTELGLASHKTYTVIFDDVIVCVPDHARRTVIEYCRARSMHVA